jgi:hypothetical protein
MTKKEKQLQKLQREIYEEVTKKETERAKKLIGKCFKFRNSYSCPDGDKDKWWYYIRVIDAQEGRCICVSHEIDKNGDVSVKKGSHATQTFDKSTGIQASYIPVGLSEYLDAFNLAVARTEDLRKVASKG